MIRRPGDIALSRTIGDVTECVNARHEEISAAHDSDELRNSGEPLRYSVCIWKREPIDTAATSKRCPISEQRVGLVS